jgi:hypothetical protein
LQSLHPFEKTAFKVSRGISARITWIRTRSSDGISARYPIRFPLTEPKTKKEKGKIRGCQIWRTSGEHGDEVPVSFDWDRCNPLTFSRCMAEHYQNAPTTCSAVLGRVPPVCPVCRLQSEIRPRYHLYNNGILCIKFALLREDFQNM